MPYSKTSEKDAETPRDMNLQKENLKLASENLELRLQLAQANIDLPRLKVRTTFYMVAESTLSQLVYRL